EDRGPAPARRPALRAGARFASVAPRGALMTISSSFRLGAAALVVLASVAGRSAGQETRRAAELRAGARVLAAEARAALVLLRDPDVAYDSLKRALEATREDPNLS